MIRMQYQVGNRHNSSPTLEVGVFLLEKDKKRDSRVNFTCCLFFYISYTFKTTHKLSFFYSNNSLRSSFRPISNSQLHTSLCFHPCPIYLIVSKGSYVIPHGISHLKGGFTLRCLQRLSLPNLATRLCHWCDNR